MNNSCSLEKRDKRSQRASELRAHNGRTRTTVKLWKAVSPSHSFSVRKTKRNPSVTGYRFRQREKGSYLDARILGEFVEEGFKDRFERLIPSAFIQGVKN